jgi:hypothetical protein
MTSWGFNFGLINHIRLSIVFLLCASIVSVLSIKHSTQLLTKLLDMVLEGWGRIIGGSGSSLSPTTVLHQR